LLTSAGEEREQAKDRLPIFESDVASFAAITAMPPERRPAEPLRCPVADEEHELERLG
jgi:hypothetical protein